MEPLGRTPAIRGCKVASALILAGIFAYAGLVKLADPVGFYQSILVYRLVGEWGAKVATAFLPAYELVLAIGLLTPRWRQAARFLIGLLLGIFLLAIVQAWIRGIDLRCGCFGGGEDQTHEILILRDLILLGLVWFSPKESARPEE